MEQGKTDPTRCTKVSLHPDTADVLVSLRTVHSQLLVGDITHHASFALVGAQVLVRIHQN